MLELRILNGLKSGISLPLDGDELLVGDADDCDIPMLDAGFAGAKFRIATDDGQLYSVDIVLGEFKWQNGEPVNSSDSWSPGAFLYCKEIWLQLALADDPWPETLPSLRAESMESSPPAPVVANEEPVKRARVPKLLILGLAGLSAFGIYSHSFASFSRNAVQGTAAGTDSNIDLAAEIANKQFNPVEKEDRDYVAIFSDMLKEREIKGVSVLKEGDKLVLSGSLSQSDRLILSRMLMRYQMEYEDGPLVKENIQSLAETFPAKIVGVVGGPYGHLLLEDGSRLTVGQSYKGYRLVKIGRDAASFEGKNSITVHW